MLTTHDIQRELAELRRKIRQDIRNEFVSVRLFLESQQFCVESAEGLITLRNVAADVYSPAAYVSTTGYDAEETLTGNNCCHEQQETGIPAVHIPKPCDHAPYAFHVPRPRGEAPSLDEHGMPCSAPLLSARVLRDSFHSSPTLPGTPEDITHGVVSDSNGTTRNCAKLERWKVLCSGLMQGRSVIHECWKRTTSRGYDKVPPRVRPSGFQFMSAAISKSWSRIDESEESVAWWVVDPFSTRRVAWDLIGISLCMYDLIMVPVITAFSMSASYESFSHVRDLFGACFWTIDMFVSFATGTLDKDGIVELRPRKIARKYVTTWFVFDFIIVTTDWSILLLNALGQSGSMRISKAFTRILRASRLLRILKISEKLQEVLGTVESELLFTIGKVMKHIAIFFVICHYFACAWYIIGTMQDDNRSWVGQFLSDNDTRLYSYAVSLHFALTQFTLGHADITPQTASELFFVSAVLVAALLVFSFFTSTMSRVVAHLEEVNSSALAQDVLIRRFCAENGVPRRLMARMRNFKRQRSRTLTRRKVNESDVEIFKALPVDIVQQLREHRFMPHLLVHPVLKQCFAINSSSLLELCWSGVEDAFLWPDQDFFPNGEQINRMIFLNTGKLRYHFRDGISMEEDEIILPGQWACEEALWSQTSWLFGPFVACDASQLILVIPEKLQEIMCRDFICRQFLGNYARLFVNAFNKASGDESDDNVLFNDPVAVEGMVKAAWEEHVKETRAVVFQGQN